MYRPDIFWPSIDLACKAVKFFRFHVAGDIMNYDYFEHMIEIAKNNPTTEILVFTKQYEIVNNWVYIKSTQHIVFLIIRTIFDFSPASSKCFASFIVDFLEKISYKSTVCIPSPDARLS